jgi:hypothetical protein
MSDVATQDQGLLIAHPFRVMGIFHWYSLRIKVVSPGQRSYLLYIVVGHKEIAV